MQPWYANSIDMRRSCVAGAEANIARGPRRALLRATIAITVFIFCSEAALAEFAVCNQSTGEIHNIQFTWVQKASRASGIFPEPCSSLFGFYGADTTFGAPFECKISSHASGAQLGV